MNPISGPAFATAALLAAAGPAKLLDPTMTTGALRSVGWPTGRRLVRCGAVAEIGVGVAALVNGGPLAWALTAAAYAGFAVFLTVALRRGGAVASCGCTSRPDTPPTRSHLAVVVLLAACSTVAATTSAAGVSAVRWTSADDVGVLGCAALAAWLAWAVISLLPRLRTASVRRPQPLPTAP